MLHCDQQHFARLAGLLARYGLTLAPVPDNAAIPGSYWGEPEAGLVGHSVHARADTPVHSVLHEAGHVICMDAARRAQLVRDAGGEFAEEDAVCYLQIVLAGELGLSAKEICADMDAWGYTFRLGSAHAWFTQDADDARAWLVRHGLLAESGTPTWQLRVA
jgi:hypothetical protein